MAPKGSTPGVAPAPFQIDSVMDIWHPWMVIKQASVSANQDCTTKRSTSIFMDMHRDGVLTDDALRVPVRLASCGC